MLFALACALAGCSPSRQQPPTEGHAAGQRPLRAIIYFQQPTADSPRLSAAVAEACRCSARYLRHYRPEALIYEVSLPPPYDFPSFDRALRKSAASWGITLVEQDKVVRPQ